MTIIRENIEAMVHNQIRECRRDILWARLMSSITNSIDSLVYQHHDMVSIYPHPIPPHPPPVHSSLRHNTLNRDNFYDPLSFAPITTQQNESPLGFHEFEEMLTYIHTDEFHDIDENLFMFDDKPINWYYHLQQVAQKLYEFQHHLFWIDSSCIRYVVSVCVFVCVCGGVCVTVGGGCMCVCVWGGLYVCLCG